MLIAEGKMSQDIRNDVLACFEVLKLRLMADMLVFLSLEKYNTKKL